MKRKQTQLNSTLTLMILGKNGTSRGVGRKNRKVCMKCLAFIGGMLNVKFATRFKIDLMRLKEQKFDQSCIQEGGTR